MKKIVLIGQPISTNNCYYHAGRGVTFMELKAKVLKNSYIDQAKKQWRDKPIEGPIAIDMKIFFGNKRKIDWDNYHKLSMDSLNGIAWVDDNQIMRAKVEKFYDKANPRLEICIESYPQ